MPPLTVPDLVPILQMAIGPVILISGVGLLLLSMTNRLGRVVDTAREMAEALRTAAPDEKAKLVAELRILMRRGRLLRSAIYLASVSVLLAAVLVFVLFLTAIFGLRTAPVIMAVFATCLGVLIAALVFFIKDVNLSLVALKLEMAANGVLDA
jgi:hypothetical protein